MYRFLLTFFIISLAALSFSQDPLWSSGGSSVSFTSNSLTPSNYPVPSPITGFSSPTLYYSPPSSFLASQAQYGENGELLFFVVNGSIFNKDGYLIAANNQGNASGCNEDCIGVPTTIALIQPEIIISPVPNLDPEENCYLFYVLMTYANLASTTVNTTVVIVDVSAKNDLFAGSDIEVMGDLVTASNFSSYTGLFASFSDPQEEDIYTSTTQGMGTGYHRLELMDSYSITANHLIVNDHNGYHIIELDAQSVFSNTLGRYYGLNSNTPSKRQIAGECEVSYNSNLGIHIMASLKPFHNKHPGIYLSRINANGTLIQDTIIAGNPNPLAGLVTDQSPVAVFGMEFSDNGRYLYINVGYGNQFVNGKLYCYDVENDAWVSLSINWNQYSARKYHLSQIEGQVYNGRSGIYIPGDSGLGILHDADVAATATFSNNAYSSPTLSYSVYQNYDGTTADIRYMSKQNHDGTAVQAFLATAECCQEGVVAMGYGDHLFDGTENWVEGNNPFSNSNSPIRIHGTLTFEDGSDIDIDDIVFEFGTEGRIVVEAGGRLELDGATLTSSCDSMWPGVVIEGTASVDQLPENGGDQGKVYVRSNSEISNAQFAFFVEAGGIIKSDNSTYRNNRTGVYFNPYSYNNVNNRSIFRDCDFITDHPMLEGIPTPRAHIEMYKVHGILIKDCSFMNTAPFQNTVNVPGMSINKRGVGIQAYNSFFTVIGDNDTYSGPTDTSHDTFYRLTNGINTTNTGPRTCDIHHMEFQENRSGIWITETENPRVVFNNFYIPSYVVVSGETNRPPEGVYLLESSGYRVEENDFSLQAMGNYARTTGLIIEDSNDYPNSPTLSNAENEVFRNSFTDLEVGLRIRGDNRAAQLDYGLQSRCEYYTNCVDDVLLEGSSEWRDDQGYNTSDPTRLTNNKFSYASPNCTSRHEHNVSNSYGPGPAHDLDFTYHALKLNSDFTWPDCLDDDNSPTITRIDRETPSSLEFEVFDYDLHCITNYPGGVVKSKAPTVLAKNNEELILEYLALQELHQGILNEYLQSLAIETPDEDIRIEANNLSGDLYRLECAIIDQFLLCDTLENGELAEQEIESYLTFLEASTNPRHDMLKVRHAMGDGDISIAYALMSEIDGLAPEDASWWYQRLELETTEELSEETEADLWSRYETATDGTANEALAYLHGHGYAHIMPTWDDEQNGNKRLNRSYESSSLISLTPNPAIDVLAVEFLGENNEALAVEVHDALGRRIERINFSPDYKLTIDLTNYPSGLYHLSISQDGQLIDNAKFIKQ